MSPVIRSDLDHQTMHAVHALEEALEATDFDDSRLSTSTL
jgi:hypothetical protein